ncbi:MAG TPA: TetR/AcrR family transcriptional regulator [Actinomycetota bacterium]|nr:TetR/AcrR family transcriptional regulator [Actinomycetota bacterium]
MTVRYRMLVRKPNRTPLTPDDWAQAALDAIARGGIEAVAVETIAAALGATKGSFYWHFESRDALIEAALARWEHRRTDAVLEKLEREPDPAVRLRKAMELGIEQGPSSRAEIALLSNPSHPSARRAVRRVAKRRLSWFREQLEALGLDERDAGDRAVLFCHIYVGNMQMAHLAPRLRTPAERKRQIDLMFDFLVAAAPKRAAAEVRRPV